MKFMLKITGRRLPLLLCLLGLAPVLSAQDTLRIDSSDIVEWQVSQDVGQNRLDSLVRIRLEQEMKKLDTNSARSRQLAEELNRIKNADSMRRQQQTDRIAQLRRTSPGVAVAPFGDSLFAIYLKLGSNTPAERAANIGERIVRVYEDNFFNADSLVIIKNDLGHELDYKKGETVLNVSEMDALLQNKTTEELASDYRQHIIQVIQQERKQNSPFNWFKRISLAILIIVGTGLLIRVVGKLFARLQNIVTKHSLLQKVSRRLKFIPEGLLQRLIRQFIKLLRLLTVVLAMYLCLPLLFYVFPDTQDITNTLLGWIISPARDILNGFLNYLPNLITIVVIYLVTHYVIVGFRLLFVEIERGQVHMAGFHRDFARPTFNIVRFVLYAFMLVVMFPYLPGSSSPAFQGVSVFLGLLLSLGSTSAINNIIAGLVITYMRPFKVGDRIRIGDTEGDVVEKNMLVIKVRSPKNEEITVPNSAVLGSNTLNFSANSKQAGLIIHSTVTIGYDTPWRKMKQTLIEAALKTDGLMKTPEPFVLQTSLDDFYVSYQINAYTQEANRLPALYSALHANILDCCREAGIEIMSPHYRSMRDGNSSTIPSE